MFRRRRSQSQPQANPLDSLEPAWRAPVEQAMAAQARFGELQRRVPAGPLRQRLEAMGRHVEQAVEACWATAQRAQEAQRILATLAPQDATSALKDARRRLERLREHERGDPSMLEAEVEDLAARHAAVHRALNSVDEAARRLQRINLQLDAAVAHALELVLRPTDVAGADRVDAELRGVVDELSALRAALGELGR